MAGQCRDVRPFPGVLRASYNYFRGGPGAGLLAGEGTFGCCCRVAREPEALQVGRAAAGPYERRRLRRPASAPAASPGACLSQALGTQARLLSAKLRSHAKYLARVSSHTDPLGPEPRRTFGLQGLPRGFDGALEEVTVVARIDFFIREDFKNFEKE